MTDTADDAKDVPFRDAESWLAERGVQRDPIRVRLPADDDAGSHARSPRQPPPPPAAAPASAEAGPPQPGAPAEAPAASSGGDAEPSGDLRDEVARAVAYARRATANTPRSERRLRRSLEDRGVSQPAIGLALERCRQQGIVDDAAFATSLVEEGRRKGHAPLRIRRDLSRRELPDEIIEAALSTIGDRDEEIAAFDVARRRASQLRGVEAETAHRRLVGYLARRGYTESLSRKVARMVVFNEEEQRRSIER